MDFASREQSVYNRKNIKYKIDEDSLMHWNPKKQKRTVQNKEQFIIQLATAREGRLWW